MLTFSLITLILAAIPVVLFLWNLAIFRAPQRDPSAPTPEVSILIPARNEAANIQSAVESALQSTAVDLEVIVLDDDSTDGTSEIVQALAKADSRLRIIYSKPLPDDWSGKMFACWQLANHATKPWLLFVDADVRLAPEAAGRLVGFAQSDDQPLALVSGPPRQITGSFAEKLLIPLIHFILLGYLPVWAMRRSTNPSFSAAIGQLLLVNREAYEKSGGHSKIPTTFHDGLNVPRILRESGYRTDLCDVTHLASCRMYHNASETWNGLLKNAAEGLGAPKTIIPMSVMLLGGHVVPWIGLAFSEGLAWQIFLAAALSGILLRMMAAIRFQQSLIGAIAHPIGITVLMAIQWTGFVKARLGQSTTWKDRSSITPE